MVEIEDWETKQVIMRDKKKLRGKNVFIDHDLTKEEREIQKALRDRATRERKEGRRVKIGYNRIDIEGENYIWNEEERKIMKKDF